MTRVRSYPLGGMRETAASSLTDSSIYVGSDQCNVPDQATMPNWLFLLIALFNFSDICKVRGIHSMCKH